MGKIIIKGQKIHFENPNQIINMGGPWIGDLFLGNKIIQSSVIIDNLTSVLKTIYCLYKQVKKIKSLN